MIHIIHVRPMQNQRRLINSFHVVHICFSHFPQRNSCVVFVGFSSLDFTHNQRTYTKEKIYNMHGWFMNMKFLPPYNFEDGPNFPKAKYLKVIYMNCLANVVV